MVQLFDCNNTSLKKGSTGAKVTLLQTHLKTLGYYTKAGNSTLKIDGVYGTYTVAAVKAFQKATGHTQDGWFGTKTCKSLNAKIQAVSGNSSTTTTSTSSATVKASSSVSSDPYAPDTSRNVFTAAESNITIDGLHFIATSITPNTGFRGGNWKRIDLLNGKQYTYKGDKQALDYTIELYIHNSDFRNMWNEFEKMSERVCKVTSSLLQSGNYTIVPSYSDGSKTDKKVSLKLTEYL